jgi:predicted GIY-YIG superfamily endonuclease
MHWVYVLLSDDGDIYVGETMRLFRRWNEHQTGRGGSNTSKGNYDTVIGLYNVAANRSFRHFRYDRNIWSCERYWKEDAGKDDALEIENVITERYLVDRGITYQSVKGGRYTVDSKCNNFCSSEVSAYDRDRPLCKCGYPCEVKMKNDNTKIYFECPIPDWVEGFNTPDRCNFWQEYLPYREQKELSLLRKPTAAEAFADCVD